MWRLPEYQVRYCVSTQRTADLPALMEREHGYQGRINLRYLLYVCDHTAEIAATLDHALKHAMACRTSGSENCFDKFFFNTYLHVEHCKLHDHTNRSWHIKPSHDHVYACLPAVYRCCPHVEDRHNMIFGNLNANH